MRITFKNIADHSKLVVAALLMGLFLGSHVFAQTDRVKPLYAGAATAFMQKLVGLLSKDIKDDDLESDILDKWQERVDSGEIFGKTEYQIAVLFWGDVKSVVQDTKISNSVWATWMSGAKPTTSRWPARFKIEDDGYSGSVLAIGYTESEQYDCRPTPCAFGRVCNPGAITCKGRSAGFRHRAYQSRGFDWLFQPAGEGYYYIFQGESERAIVAGDYADNNIYFQVPNGRDNAKWKLVPLGNNRFYITDKKHGRSLVAGNNPDGNIYHQVPDGRRNAIWKITYLQGESNIPSEIKTN